MSYRYYKVRLTPAHCGLDLGDGSERAEYVPQDYILHKLGRPHRHVSIMYTYYPNDKEWPARISKAWADKNVTFQWDYPYDDYFPYLGGLGGSTDGEPFTFMKDIRRHGQDVALTLTIDCGLSDEQLRAVARDLRPYGRMRLRINHECNGSWFTHNKRYTYQQVADFYVRFARIVKEEAPNVTTVFCAGFVNPETGKVDYQQEFADAYRAADVWSADCYLSLHYSWPYDVAEKGGTGFKSSKVEEYFNLYKDTAEVLKQLNGGVLKPWTIAEFNADGDVCGPRHQGDAVLRFAHMFRDTKADWFDGFTLYQFRDRGRLGLEIEDPNNAAVGIEQPMLKEYKQLLNDPWFMPGLEKEEASALPMRMRWGGSEDADGAAIGVDFEATPEFCEISFDDPLALMIELNGHWFYKAPGTKTVDLMPAFFEKPLEGPCHLPIHLFATPADGVNDPSQGEDWQTNYYAELTKEPQLRIRYEPVL